MNFFCNNNFQSLQIIKEIINIILLSFKRKEGTKLGNCFTAKTFDDRVGVYCMLEAVRKGNLHILTGRYAAVPGPRFVQLLDEFCEIIQGGE